MPAPLSSALMLLTLSASAAEPAAQASAAAPMDHAAAPLAPDLPQGLVLTGLDGATIDFDALRGKPVLVNLWASWCPPCLVELPQLKAVHETWAPRGLVVVGLAIDDQPGKVRQRISQHGLTWPVAFDSSSHASPAFGTDELPTTLLYDGQGRARWQHKGELSAQDPALLRVLAELLPAPTQQPGPSQTPSTSQ